MKLFFDARYIRIDYHDGISRYSAELGSALALITPLTFLICDPLQLLSLPQNSKFLIIHKPTSVIEPFTALILNNHEPDLIFSPMQTIGSIGKKFKLILTLHDMIYYHHRTPPRQLNALLRVSWRLYHMTYLPQRLTLNKSDTVATVSQTSKRDIETAKLTNKPVVVIPNAPQNLGRFLSENITYDQAPRNLIYMGSFMAYKNVETLIAGMEFLPGYTLHLLSRITSERQATLTKLIPKGAAVIFHSGVSDEEYTRLLGDNAILVSASRDEGYGLPISEALVLGVPAVVSDLPIHHEVAGNGALYFDPDSPADFAKKVASIDASHANKLSKAGKKYISRYNWQTSAEILYQTALRLTQKTTDD